MGMLSDGFRARSTINLSCNMTVTIANHVQEIVDRLHLQPHPEGGFFREMHRSQLMIPSSALPADCDGDRPTMTSILFLLPTGMQSNWHRLRSEELWLHQQGDDLHLDVAPSLSKSDEDDQFTRTLIGQSAEARLQAVVPARNWQRATPLSGSHGYTLVACVVSPGFDFSDFELAD